MKRIIACFLALCLLAAALPMAFTVSAAAKTYTFDQLVGYYKTQGRVSVEGTALNMDTSGSGFEWYFYGSGDVMIGADVKCTYTNNMFLTVIVDGERSRVEVVNTSTGVSQYHAMTLATGLEEGYHHIEVYKQTEASSALMTVWGITFDGTLMEAPPADTFTMEVVGDSISGGASNLATNDTANASYPVYQDGTQTYAYLVGEDLNANVRVTQTSGYGCCGGWNAQGTDLNLQHMYPYTSYWRDHTDTGLYDFDPPADVVVINLGTNDASAAKYGKISLTDAQFKAGAKNLITMATTNNPGAQVVWVTGMMGVTYQTVLTELMNELGGTDAGYHFLILPENTEGGEGHPTVAGHAAAATVLKDYLVNNVLPADHSARTVVLPQLKQEIERAQTVEHPSAALTRALALAQMEIDTGTTDPYRFGYRYYELRKAIDGYAATVDLMPVNGVSVPYNQNGQYVWPYYDAEGPVTLYKGGEGVYWPYIHTEYETVVDLDVTPYLVLETSSTAEWNVHIAFRGADGTQHTVTATEAAGSTDVNFPANLEQTTKVINFAEYVRSYADSEGRIVLVGCDLYVVGTTDTYAKYIRCELTEDGGEQRPTAITGSTYPVTGGVIDRVTVGMTTEELIAAMDNAAYLRAVDKDGTPVSGVTLKTDMRLELVVDGNVADEAAIAVIGDTTCDGKLSTLDAREAMLYSLVEDYGFSAAQIEAADMDDNGTVNTSDVRRLLITVLTD